jgi:YbbR domain-containing protein
MLRSSRFGKVVKKMLKKIIDSATHNITWKIISILIAFFFWWAVVSYEDPIREVTFDNVPVDKVNVESITDNNYAIEYQEGEYVQVVVKAKKSIVDKLTTNDIYVYADISNMSITNAIDIQAQVDIDFQSINIYPANMKVKIENIVSANKEVQYYFEGEVAEGYIALDPIITPNVIQVTGPESQVALISSVIVPIPIAQAKKDVTLYYAPDLLDSQNNPVSKITTNISEVSITVPVEMTKEVGIVFTPIGKVPEEYRLISTLLSRNKVVIKGKETAIQGIDNIVINDIILNEIVMNTELDLFLENYLPSSVDIIVEPLIEKILEFSSEDIDVKNLPEGYIFSYDTEEAISITVKGIAEELDDVTIESLDPYIRLTNLETGTHDIVINYYVPYGVDMISEEQSISITLEEVTEAVPIINN